MKCDRCGCEIDNEYAKISKGYCKECGATLVTQAINDYNAASDLEKLKFQDKVAAEVLSRGML